MFQLRNTSVQNLTEAEFAVDVRPKRRPRVYFSLSCFEDFLALPASVPESAFCLGFRANASTHSYVRHGARTGAVTINKLQGSKLRGPSS